MKRHILSASIGLCMVGAFAQPAQNAGPGAEREAGREQRRVELRNALQNNRKYEVQPDAVAPKEYLAPPRPPPGRHLSARELAEMRQQLRQQQPVNQRLPAP